MLSGFSGVKGSGHNNFLFRETILYTSTSALIVQSHDDRGVSALTINGTSC